MKLQVKKYSQNNPEWEDIKVGNSDYTIGDAGCYISCLAMTLDYYGKGKTPEKLNEVLTQIKAYNGALLNMWTAAKHFNFTFGGLENFDNEPAPVDRIIKRIDDGHPTIIRVDFIVILHINKCKGNIT
ncbi:hypothetical protein AKJ59_00570 [candidate division MSBL1 archaeon SCGC-AAA385M02]|uniref:Peptidase C39-like domain-containing protein n=1 Tax=candidate division MSBL1 archaeon SCGC-AAA385M02 TaxID=1698287 RepID=A0A133VQJ7_9EURY|nr:hypothetical protein AKJ59_00570 [candidate division MSBL1 archaeon SCGC-AAA385M02]